MKLRSYNIHNTSDNLNLLSSPNFEYHFRREGAAKELSTLLIAPRLRKCNIVHTKQTLTQTMEDTETVQIGKSPPSLRSTNRVKMATMEVTHYTGESILRETAEVGLSYQGMVALLCKSTFILEEIDVSSFE